jgi:hypothetical protein
MATSIVLFLLINLVGKGCFQPSPFWSVAQPGIRGVGLELPVRDAHRNPGTVLVFHQVGREFRGVLSDGFLVIAIDDGQPAVICVHFSIHISSFISWIRQADAFIKQLLCHAFLMRFQAVLGQLWDRLAQLRHGTL